MAACCCSLRMRSSGTGSRGHYTFAVTDNGSTRTVTAADLLARTVLYKVGHHSSFNATMKAKGLERMRRDDLVALIPLDSVTAENKWEETSWPATNAYAALCERTVGRVLRSDTGWPAASDRPSDIPKRRGPRRGRKPKRTMRSS